MRSTIRRLMIGLLTMTAMGALSVSPASAAVLVPTALALPGYGDVLVDEAHQQVFVSGGPTANSVVVTDALGLPKKSIDNLPGATGLEISADGAALYVALAAGDAVAVVDTVTLTETARYRTGTQTCPTYLARSGTQVWYGYGCEGSFTGKIGRFDTAAKTVTGDLQGAVRFQRAPLLTSGGSATGAVVAGQLSLSLSTVQVYNPQSNGTLALGATGDVLGAGLSDLDLTNNGATLYSSATGRDRIDVHTSATLSRTGAYSVRPRGNSVALDPTEGYLAAGAITPDDNDVLVYKVGASTPTKTVTLPQGDVVAPRGLAWVANLSRLVIISQTDNDPTPRLSIVPLATTV